MEGRDGMRRSPRGGGLRPSSGRTISEEEVQSRLAQVESPPAASSHVGSSRPGGAAPPSAMRPSSARAISEEEVQSRLVQVKEESSPAVSAVEEEEVILRAVKVEEPSPVVSSNVEGSHPRLPEGAAPPSAMRPLFNPGENLAVPSSAAGGISEEEVILRAVKVEEPSPVVSPHVEGSLPRLPEGDAPPSAMRPLFNPGENLAVPSSAGGGIPEDQVILRAIKVEEPSPVVSPHVEGSLPRLPEGDAPPSAMRPLFNPGENLAVPSSDGDGIPEEEEVILRAIKVEEPSPVVSPHVEGPLPRLPEGDAPPSAMRPLFNPVENLAVPSSGIPEREINVVQPSPVVSSDGGNLGGGLGVGASQNEPVKKKLGRPRKYGPDRQLLSPTTPGSGTDIKPFAGIFDQLIPSSVGMGFTVHTITIDEGEDITSKIMSFSQQIQRNICILSANGTVSTATLCHSEAASDTVTYEGRFEILRLSGSYMVADDGGQSGGLVISISNPNDSRMIGGRVGGGPLTAATSVQVCLGSFVQEGSKDKNKHPANI